MNPHELRFGVRSDEGAHAAVWDLWTQERTRRDVYLASSGMRGQLHASIHASGRWHVAFSKELHRDAFAEGEAPESRFPDEWPRPQDISPGFVLAFRILVPWFSATSTSPVEDGPDVAWAPSAPVDNAVEFAVVITAPERKVTDWPCKNSMGAELSGRLRLSNGDSVWVVHRVTPYALPPDQTGRVRHLYGTDAAALQSPNLRMIGFGDAPDGSRVLHDVPFSMGSG